jgi:Fe-S oxidoreductase
MIERITQGYDPFVLPFMFGLSFLLLYLGIGVVRIIAIQLSWNEKKMLVKHIFSFKIFKTIWDIIIDCLIHVKIFKKNFLLGYMHSSIAFGWFMLILIGHIEVWLYTPQRTGLIYYPVFFRYFVMETHQTMRGAFFFFLMDLFLLIVISGIALALYKRFSSKRMGMKKTTKHDLRSKIAIYSLWAIFPLRLIAESYTVDICGGGFLTKSVNTLMSSFTGSMILMEVTWWAYSVALGLFMLFLPFSRYMHIPTEMLLILLRNSGIKSSSSRRGYAETEIYSCSSCGICIDSCPMTAIESKDRYMPIYYIRSLRRRRKKSLAIAAHCLVCGKCENVCPVGIDSASLRIHKKREKFNNEFLSYDYLQSNLPESYKMILSNNRQSNVNDSVQIANTSGISSTIVTDNSSATATDNSSVITTNSTPLVSNIIINGITKRRNKKSVVMYSSAKVLYYAGCMTHLTPAIYRALFNIMEKAEVKYTFMDKDGSICCGRPLLISGGKTNAKELIESNRKAIEESDATILLLSCPICYKMFKEEYNLHGIEVMHHSEYLEKLIKEGAINVEKTELSMSYHDPCDLGRGSGIYDQPRTVLCTVGTLKRADEERSKSICCGASLGSTKFSHDDRLAIARESLRSLCVENPDILVTSCPLCLKSFSCLNNGETIDIAQIVDRYSSPAKAEKLSATAVVQLSEVEK